MYAKEMQNIFEMIIITKEKIDEQENSFCIILFDCGMPCVKVDLHMLCIKVDLHIQATFVCTRLVDRAFVISPSVKGARVKVHVEQSGLQNVNMTVKYVYIFNSKQ